MGTTGAGGAGRAEPQAEALSEAEFEEQLGRMVAEAEGREYVPPEPEPGPLPDAGVLGAA